MADFRSACLSDEELERFASGSSGDPWGEASNPLSGHLAECARCRSAVESIRHNNATLGEMMPRGLSSLDSVLRTAPTPSIPGYRIVGEVHRGAQGVVYEAEQLSTHRRVAVKVMREGPLADAHERARFDREVRVLAQLKHPHIVTIHDSGEAGGLSYIVMDYVDGPSLDEYVSGKVEKSKSRRVETEELLRLFAEIAEAVNAAHLLGVIHRDLKPSNIRIDAKGEPRVLDFGLAKLSSHDGIEAPHDSLSPQSSALNPFTVTGQFVGSLPYASPEQAEGAQDKIDVRTDVYSLGVILYRILTGAFPYDVAGNLPDVLNNIRHAEPLRMGAAAAAKASALLFVASFPARRDRSVAFAIDDEIETIVLKCLQKNPQRRYQSAGEMARDLRHYLAGEPIEAKRDSTWYVLRKALNRHRGAFVAAMAFVALLVGSALMLAISYRKQTEQAAIARREAESARKQAAIADSVNKLMQDVLAGADRIEQQGNPDVRVREMLDAAARQLDEQRGQYEPEVEAAVHGSVGRIYRSLSLYAEAEQHLQRALELHQGIQGAEHELTAQAHYDLGVVLQDRGDWPASERSFREALRIRERVFGETHVAVAETLMGLSAVLLQQSRLNEAEPLISRALAMREDLLGPDHLDVADSLQILAELRRAAGDATGAVSLHRRALDIRRRRLGDHGLVARSLTGLGLALNDLLEHAAAESAFREALDMAVRFMGEDHASIATLKNNLGLCLIDSESFDEAESLYREVIALLLKQAGQEHPRVAVAYVNLADALRRNGKFSEAVHFATDAVATYDRLLGPGHVRASAGMNIIAQGLQGLGDPRAEHLFRQALAVRRQAYDELHPLLAVSLYNLAEWLREHDQLEEADGLHREALAIRLNKYGPDHPNVAMSYEAVAQVLLALGDCDDADPMLRQALLIRRLAEAQGIPGAVWRRTNAESVLGEVLLTQAERAVAVTSLLEGNMAEGDTGRDTAQQLFEEAEGLLVRGYEDLCPPPYKAMLRNEAMQRLVRLYDSWNAAEPGLGHAANAAEYRLVLRPAQSINP